MSKALGHFGASAPGCLQDYNFATLMPWCLCDLVPYQSLIPIPRSLLNLPIEGDQPHTSKRLSAQVPKYLFPEP